MPSSPQIIVVGSHAAGLFVDLQRPPLAGETVMGWNYREPVDGGKGSNQAIAAARLGARVSFVGCVGQDRQGDNGERWLHEAGVDTTHLRRSESASTFGGFVMLDSQGVPAIVAVLGANGELSEEDVETALRALPKAQIMLTQFEIRPEVALHAARVARQLGMTTIVNAAPVPESLPDGLSMADILTPNETEAMALLGLDPTSKIEPTALARQLRQQFGVEAVVITVGAEGVVAAEASRVWQVKPPPVQAVDTTGAGDTFNAALAVGLVEGQSLRQAAQWACHVAALSVTKAGTIPIFPTQAEVEQFLAQARSSNHGL